MALRDSFEQLREFQDIVCRVSLLEETTLKLQDRADAGATAALVDGNHTKEVVAAAEAGGGEKERRKNKTNKTNIKGRKE